MTTRQRYDQQRGFANCRAADDHARQRHVKKLQRIRDSHLRIGNVNQARAFTVEIANELRIMRRR